MRSFFRKKFGGSMTDYAIGVGLIAGGVLGGIAGLGGDVEDIIDGVNDSISGEVGEQTPGSESGNSSGADVGESGESENGGSGSGAEGSGDSGGSGNSSGEGSGGGSTTDPDPDETTPDETTPDETTPDPDTGGTTPDPDPTPEPEPDVQEGDFQFVENQINATRVLDEFDLFLYTKNNNGSGVTYTVNGTIPYGTNYTIMHDSSISHYMDFYGEVRRPGTYNFSVRADLNGTTDYDLNNYSIEILPYYNAFIPEVKGYDDKPGSTGSTFGSAVAVDGDDVYIVSRFRDNEFDGSGRIYKFDYDSQVEQLNFEPTDTEDFVGPFYDLQIEGNSLFTGTEGWNNYVTPLGQSANRARGAIYEFDKLTGNQIKIYSFPENYTTDASNGFGKTFTVNESYIAMSAPFLDYGSTSDVGRVYVYPRNGSGNLQTFYARSPIQSNELFGASLALYNNYLFISSPNKNRQGLSSGVVYMYDLTTGSLIREIIPSDLKASDSLGFAMDVSNGILAVGALIRSEVGTGIKTIYFFDANTGNQIDKLRSSEVGDGDPFFTRLSMDGNHLVLSSIEASGDAGKIYVYDITQKRMIASFSGDINRGIYKMGSHFDIDGRRIVVGSPSGPIEQVLKYDF